VKLLDEQAVIKKIKSGDNEILSQIYEGYRQEFIAWIMKNYACTVEEAKDVYQNTILIFYENIINGKLRHFSSSIKTYLFAVGKNKIMEHKKKSYKYSSQEDIPELTQEETNLESLSEHESELNMVETCLHLLGDPCMTLLKLYYYQKLSMPAITERLHYKNADTTKNLKYKCIQRLKKLYEEEIVKQH